MTHRLATNYAKNYCNRTPIVKVIVEYVLTCFFGGTRWQLQPPTRSAEGSFFTPVIYLFISASLGCPSTDLAEIWHAGRKLV